MEGWPEGWACFGAGGPNERFVSAGDRYVLYGEREGCRRAAWAIEGGAGAVDREALAKALHDAFNAAVRGCSVWEDRSEGTRQGCLAEADEAIRLLVGSAKPAKALYDEIEELERANAALTATANAAVARAEEAQLQAQRAEDGGTIAAAEEALFAAGAPLGSKLMDGIAAVAAGLRVADARCAKQERENGDLRAEVQRLRRALDRTAQGAAYLTDAISELTGGDHA